MNRRLLLIAACAILPSTSLGAQIAQPGELSADKSAQANRADKEERKARKKGSFAGAGIGLGAGMAFASRSDAENVTQQEFCIGACAPLRRSNRAAFSDVLGERVGPTSGSPERSAATQGGVLALLGALGSVSEDAIDALTDASGRTAVSSDDAAGNSNASAQRSGASNRNGATPAGVIADRSDFDAAMNGCILGCEPPAAAGLMSSSPGTEDALFVAPGSTGPMALAGGDVNTIVNPEPSTVVLMLSGLAAMAAIARRKRNEG